MAKKTDKDVPKDDALAVAPADSLAVSTDAAALDALCAAGLDAEVDDGMGEFRPDDFRTPVKLYNLQRKLPDGTMVTKDNFFDSVHKTVSGVVHLALVHLHKSNDYSVFDQKEGRNVVVCRAQDQLKGTMADGTVRPCQGCPDKEWKTQADGKRRPNCSEVWNMAAVDLDYRDVCIIRFKRTSLEPIRSYLQTYFLNKRPLPGGRRGNIPIFAYPTEISLVMDRGGQYAMPIIKRGDAPFAPELLKQLAETAEGVRATLLQRLEDAERNSAEMAAAEQDDTSFDTEAMGGADGQRGAQAFVE